MNQSISNERVLTLTNITAPIHGGLYTCVVINPAGNESDYGTLNVLPEFIIQPEDINTTAGEYFNLTCVAEAFPLHSIQWQKMNRTTGLFEDIPGENRNFLEFNPVEHANFGMYQCIAQNNISGDLFFDTSYMALITVSPENSLTLTPGNMTFNYQDEAVLTCTVEGGPMNTFEWYLNDTQVVSGTYNINISSALLYSTLTISSVNAPVHGGTYTCIVSNNAGYDEIETYLFVSPRFIQQPNAQTSILNGLNTSISCVAEAFPVPTYLWMNNDTEIVGDPEPVLYFRPALFEDEGVYNCHASSNNLTIYSDDAELLGQYYDF